MASRRLARSAYSVSWTKTVRMKVAMSDTLKNNVVKFPTRMEDGKPVIEEFSIDDEIAMSLRDLRDISVFLFESREHITRMMDLHDIMASSEMLAFIVDEKRKRRV